MRPANAHDTIDAPIRLAAAALLRDKARQDARDAAGQAARRTIDEVMAQASRRLRRVGPHLAAVELQAGALLVDTRSQAQREAKGEVPGALRVERSVLE